MMTLPSRLHPRRLVSDVLFAADNLNHSRGLKQHWICDMFDAQWQTPGEGGLPQHPHLKLLHRIFTHKSATKSN